MLAHSNTREEDSVTILNVTGEFTLRDKVWQAMETGSGRILLNMAGMPRIDSFGIGEPVAAYTSIVRAGGELKLAHVTRQVRAMLDLTGLCAVFEIHEDESSALRSFSAMRFESRTELFFG